MSPEEREALLTIAILVVSICLFLVWCGTP